MEKLLKGLHTFQAGYFRPRRELFNRLAHQQHPEALFITCADSRINPNLLTQSEPGQLFILRNAGNIVPPHGASSGGEEATIEFAVTGLGIQDIIVCGHSDCGAIAGLLEPERLADMPSVERWLANAEATRRIVRENYYDVTGEALRQAAAQENVLVQLEHLRTIPAVAAKLARKQLHLHGWYYRIETGEVFAYQAESGQFEPLIPAESEAAMRDDARRVVQDF
jgi:carbonic anhydrase